MKKIKSFGLIESVAASTIVVVLVSGALALASSSMKTSSSDQAYLEAENIAEYIFEKVQEKKTLGEAYFVKPTPTPSKSFNIRCFDNEIAYPSGSACFEGGTGQTKTGLGYSKNDMVVSGSQHLVPYNKAANPAFGVGFFRYSVGVTTPSYFSASSLFPKDKIVAVNVEVTWSDVGGEKKYYARQYFSDWER